MPDIENLKIISELVDVSTDYLLDENEKISFNEIKEPIHLKDYEKTGKCRSRQDAACLAKYKDADSIVPLIRVRKLNIKEWIVDTLVQPNILLIGDYLNTGIIGFYLVENKGKQSLVSVSKDFITTRELPVKINKEKFVIGKYRFKKAGYELI